MLCVYEFLLALDGELQRRIENFAGFNGERKNLSLPHPLLGTLFCQMLANVFRAQSTVMQNMRRDAIGRANQTQQNMLNINTRLTGTLCFHTRERHYIYRMFRQLFRNHLCSPPSLFYFSRLCPKALYGIYKTASWISVPVGSIFEFSA